MLPYDATDTRWNEEPAQRAEARREPEGGLLQTIFGDSRGSGLNPNSRGGKFTYAETTGGAMRFIEGVCKIAMPKKYDAKKAVDSSGNVKSYMLASQINMIVQALFMAGYGQVQARVLGTMGTFLDLLPPRPPGSMKELSWWKAVEPRILESENSITTTEKRSTRE